MPDVPISGINSYAAEVDADGYLDDSVRATSWASKTDATKRRALITAFRLIERQRLAGEPTGVVVATAVAVAVGGTGYAVGAVLTTPGGVRVEVVTAAGGIVSAVQLIDAGSHAAAPSNPVTTTSSGAGTGCTLNLTTGAQTLHFPATGLVDKQGAALSDDLIPQAVREAQIELAFELLVNGALETSGGQGNDKRSVQAGSARVEWFKASGGPNGVGGLRFPPIVQELLAPFLAGREGTPPEVSGAGDDITSDFDAGSDYPHSVGLT